MWWWQSQALAGAFSLGASVPSDHLTCCAAASLAPAPIMPAAAPADIVISNSRRPQEIAAIASSHGLWRRGLSTEVSPSPASTLSEFDSFGRAEATTKGGLAREAKMVGRL